MAMPWNPTEPVFNDFMSGASVWYDNNDWASVSAPAYTGDSSWYSAYVPWQANYSGGTPASPPPPPA